MIKKLVLTLVIGLGLIVGVSSYNQFKILYIHTVPTTFAPENQKKWSAIENEILDSSNKYVLIDWEGYGGEVLMSNHLYAILQYAEDVQHKTVILNIIGPSVSASAIIVCYASSLIIREGASITFHPMRSEDSKGIPSYQLGAGFDELQTSDFDTCKARGFLSDDDLKSINVDHKQVVIYKQNGKLVKKVQEDN